MSTAIERKPTALPVQLDGNGKPNEVGATPDPALLGQFFRGVYDPANGHSGKVCLYCARGDGKRLDDYPGECATLRTAISEGVPSKDGKFPSPRSIGVKLHHLRGRVLGGRFLDSNPSLDGRSG